MIVLVSNREVDQTANDERVFGDKINPKGINELRLATARYIPEGKRWVVELKDETEGNPKPSQAIFNQVVSDTKEKKISPHWVLYVHGFNASMTNVLDWCLDLESNYKVNVLAFAWPSNQGGFVLNEYRSAQRAAQASITALDRIFEILTQYINAQSEADRVRCPVRFSLLFHSLGNFLAESLFRSPLHVEETNIFDNVILHQADVDSRSHSEWVDKIVSPRTYVTHNISDRVLRKSDVINPTRLGQRLRGSRGDDPIYIDFSDGKSVGDAHNLLNETRSNNVIQTFWRRVLTGKSGEVIDGIAFDAASRTYKLEVLDL